MPAPDEPTCPSDDAVAVAEAVLGASRVLVAVAVRSLAAIDEDEISITQFRALVVPQANVGTRPVDLAQALGTSRSSATRLCDRLVYKGLITRARDVGDRREVTLGLTDRGRRLVKTVIDRRRADITEIVERIPPRKRSALAAALTTFGDAAGEISDRDYGPIWGL